MHEPVKVERWGVHILIEMVLNLSHFSNGRIPSPQDMEISVCQIVVDSALP